MKLGKRGPDRNMHYKHFRVNGPIDVDGDLWIYAIPKTKCAGRVLLKRGYSRIMTFFIHGWVYRKPVTRLKK